MMFHDLHSELLNSELESQLHPYLVATIQQRGAGHCMRLTDLDQQLMEQLAQSIRRDLPDAQVFILTDRRPDERAELYITSTKLVELRNPGEDGDQRPPLLVMIPANLRTSAEDSFSVATFEELNVSDVYQRLVDALVLRLPVPLQGLVRAAFSELRQWPWADVVARARFLLTAGLNNADGESLGASLYQLGLVPDRTIFTDPSTLVGRIRRNLDSVRALTHAELTARGRVLSLGLIDRTLQRRLMQLLLETGLENPRYWSRSIVLDRRNYDLTFDKWKFSNERNPDRIRISAVITDLPQVEETESRPLLREFIGQQWLAPQSRKRFSVSFSVDPHPTQIPALDHFTIQLMAREDPNGDVAAPLGVTKKLKAWTGRKQTGSISFDKLSRIDFETEGGWYFVRVLAWTKEGDPIPLEMTEDERSGKIQKQSNESDPFFVIPGADINEDTRPRAIPRADSLEHARLRLRCKAVRERTDPQLIEPTRIAWPANDSRDMLSVQFGSAGIFNIVITPTLYQLESQTLNHPERCAQEHYIIERGALHQSDSIPLRWTPIPESEQFRVARQRYFEAVRGERGDLLTQGADLVRLLPVVIAYAGAYLALLQALATRVEQTEGPDRYTAISELLSASQIDTIRLYLPDLRDARRDRNAALLAPTHPLRALWLATWTQLGTNWVRSAEAGTVDDIARVEDAILRRLSPVDLPAFIAQDAGRLFTAIDTILGGWTLYASPSEPDPRGLLSDVCQVLGATEPTTNGGVITPEMLAQRVDRYLEQHPYTRALSINLFNPGAASLVAETLIKLQAQPALERLRYDIRIFVADPEASQVGDALLSLMRPGSSLSREEVEAFAVSSGSHISPKLSVAVRSTQAFLERPTHYRAHLSMLFDAFPASDVSVETVFTSEETIPLHGLIQDFAVRTLDNEGDSSGWVSKRQPRHGSAQPLSDAKELVELLEALPRLLSGVLATVATSTFAMSLRPVVTLSLTPEQRQMLHRIHETSDWVCTIDRHLGIEFFDHGRTDGPSYLIDYVPGSITNVGHQLIITTRSHLELETLLTPLLASYGLPSHNEYVSAILRQLRSISSRLTLKLIGTVPTQQAEALGLALAHAYLRYQQALLGQIIVPLDDHQGLFTVGARAESEVSASFRRTDLALFSCEPTTRQIICRLVEVKCYGQGGDISGYQQLRAHIAEQLADSEVALRSHYDPLYRAIDRPDRLLKTRELALLLEYHLDHAARHMRVDANAASAMKAFFQTLEQGYILTFTRSALIFDFSSDGTEPADIENDVEYHRIGQDLVRELVILARQDLAEPEAQAFETSTTTIPILKKAAFVSAQLVPTSRPERTPPTALPSSPSEGQVLPISMDTGMADAAVDSVVADMMPSIGGTSLQRQDLINNESNESIHEYPEPSEELHSIREVTRDLPVLKSDVFLGVNGTSPQYGLIGEAAGRRVALDLNQTHTISLFGVQGSGKSYTLGSIIEMACMSIPNINQLTSPLATLLFHYSRTEDYQPEFTSMIRPNSVAQQIEDLRLRYQALPQALHDIVLLVPKAQVETRTREFPGVTVYPLTFAANELKAEHWRFLMGLVGGQRSLYVQQMNMIMRTLRQQLTVETLRHEVEASDLTEQLKRFAKIRIDLAAQYIDDNQTISVLLKPGRLIIVDLRDGFTQEDEALGLFVVLLQLFSEATYNGRHVNKLVVFDEAHKYIQNDDLVVELKSIVSEMRHKATSILIASQDPRSVHQSLIELSTQIILHRFNSPDWLKHIQRVSTALGALSPEKMNNLQSGEVYVWSREASERVFSVEAVKVRWRPRVTQHGGATKTAVSSADKEAQ